MSFVDRIAHANDIGEVFDLVNEFINARQYASEIHQVPTAVRPERINTADDLSYWLTLVSEEIRCQGGAKEETPDIVFALHAVLDTAVQRLRSDWYH